MKIMKNIFLRSLILVRVCFFCLDVVDAIFFEVLKVEYLFLSIYANVGM